MIINGLEISQKLRQSLMNKVGEATEKGIRPPGLAVIQVGNNPASTIYVRNKKRGCASVGIHSFGYELSEDGSEAELLSLIDDLNKSSEVDGILVQLPLPKKIDEERILNAIDPSKDVDGFHPVNAGLLMQGKQLVAPCTPLGIMKMLADAQISLAGKNVVIVGRSNIVGKPLAQLMLQANATVTIAHSHTKNLSSVCQGADVIVAAIGKPHFISNQFVSKGQVIIDVGINRLDDGKVVGDVDFVNVEPIVQAISPVPNGVGPMTISMLLQNTVTLWQHHLAAEQE